MGGTSVSLVPAGGDARRSIGPNLQVVARLLVRT